MYRCSEQTFYLNKTNNTVQIKSSAHKINKQFTLNK